MRGGHENQNCAASSSSHSRCKLQEALLWFLQTEERWMTVTRQHLCEPWQYPLILTAVIMRKYVSLFYFLCVSKTKKIFIGISSQGGNRFILECTRQIRFFQQSKDTYVGFQHFKPSQNICSTLIVSVTVLLLQQTADLVDIKKPSLIYAVNVVLLRSRSYLQDHNFPHRHYF